MSRDTSGLTPFKPGQTGNPAGHNQYSYRREAERDLANWCKEHGKDLIERLLEDARKGRGYAMKLALDRILPAVQRHEVESSVAPPLSPEFLPSESEQLELECALSGTDLLH